MWCNGQGNQANHESWAQIGQVKEKISNEKGWEASQQKLIYSGMHRKWKAKFLVSSRSIYGIADPVPLD